MVMHQDEPMTRDEAEALVVAWMQDVVVTEPRYAVSGHYGARADRCSYQLT